MKTITAYQTDPDGIYLFEVKARQFVLDPERYNVPYAAVLKKPPVIKQGKRARWISSVPPTDPAYLDGTWKIESDPAQQP